MASSDPLCDLAHGIGEAPAADRTLVAVFASPVAGYLLHFARHLGFRTVLVDPRPVAQPPPADRIGTTLDRSFVDGSADVVVTDHDRPELGELLRDALALPTRWLSTGSSATRSWAIVSRSRTVTALSCNVSKSTVMQNGVPISSCRR